jgi:TPR repeat protein
MAIFKVGQFYNYGLSVAENRDLAIKNYKKAASMNLSNAHYSFGNIALQD